jgi:hypothetical protein
MSTISGKLATRWSSVWLSWDPTGAVLAEDMWWRVRERSCSSDTQSPSARVRFPTAAVPVLALM